MPTPVVNRQYSVSPSTGEAVDASALALKIQENIPVHPYHLLSAALQRLQNHDLEAAKMLCIKALAMDDKRPDTWILLGMVYQRKFEFFRAIDCFQNALSRNELLAHSVYTNADIQKRCEEVAKHIVHKLKIHENFPVYLRSRDENGDLIIDFKYKDVLFSLAAHDSFVSLNVSVDIMVGETYRIVDGIGDIDVVLDIGANIGAATVYFSKMYPNAMLFSFEPNPEILRFLTRNIGNNPNINIFPFGLANKTEVVNLYLWHDSVHASVFQRKLNAPYSKEVQLVDILEFISQKSIEKIDILKLDTEGCEVEILTRILHLIPAIKVIYIECHSHHDFKVVSALFEKSHYLHYGQTTDGVFELCYVKNDYFNKNSVHYLEK